MSERRRIAGGSLLAVAMSMAALIAAAGEAPAPQAEKELPASYYAELARVNHSYRQLDEAIRLYQKAIELEEDATRRAGYAGSLAEIYVAQDEHAKALPLLRQAVEAATSASTRSRYRMLMAQIAEAADDFDAAEAAYKEALAAARHDFERSAALRKLLALYQRAEKLDEIIARHEQSVAQNPEDTESLELLATAYTTVARDRDKAIAVLAQLAEVRPQPLTLRRLASAYQSAGRQKEAIATYEGLLEKDPQNHAYYCERISQLHAAAGDQDAALTWARKIAAKSPDDPHAATRLARLLVRLGQPKEAIAEYERAAAKARSALERERTLIACAEAARSARLYDKAEAILRRIAHHSQSADHRAQAKAALFQLYEEQDRLDELQIKTRDDEGEGKQQKP
ncbi:MAG: tetratricopeptide repeat protein [Planctomycetota bacterium]